MRIPKSVRIAGLDYAVERVSQTGLELQAEGHINYREQLITLCDTGQAYAKVTFLHECLHGMLEALGLTEANQDKRLIDGLAHQLFLFLSDNPQMFRYLLYLETGCNW